jgi:hypothetical protein
MSLKLEEIEWRSADHDECTMTVTWPGLLSWLTRGRFGKRHSMLVRGRCTVWHYYPSGERVGTMGEGELCDLWQAAKWRMEAR